MDIDEIKARIEKELSVEITAADLDGIYDEVKKYISTVHPDKFTDGEIREENHQKTIKATGFLSELKKEIERKRATEKALVPYDENKINLENYEYRIIIKETEAFQLRKTIVEKENEILDLKNKISELKKLNEQVRSSQISAQKEQVVNTFKPKSSSLITAGTVTGIIIFYNILGQIEIVSKKIASYLPVSEKTTNMILFTILFLTLIVIIYKTFQASFIKKFLDTIITQNNIAEIGQLVNAGVITRQQIHDFIINKIREGTKINRMKNKIFNLGDPIVVEEAINMVVDYMIGNSFIERINVKNMIQHYRVMELSLWEVYIASKECSL